MDERRIYAINDKPPGKGPVVYWMSRDQRSNWNPALLRAREIAAEIKQPLVVVFCLAPEFLGATIRHYSFMLRGLSQVRESLLNKDIPFFLLRGEPGKELPRFIGEIGAGTLVTDFDPLRIKRKWKREVAKKINIRFEEVDAHNVAPCRIVSQKMEYGAYTIRPKIKKLLPEFLEPLPSLRRNPVKPDFTAPEIDWDKLIKSLKVDRSVPEIDWLKPGEKAARAVLKKFIQNRLPSYADKRNDPNEDVCSDLSPYLHFGQISALQVSLEVKESGGRTGKNEADFLEELIVRRELSDNYCFYNADYDTLKNVPDWVKKTHDAHRDDPREYIYSLKEFEIAATHDALWNAAQMEMVKRGKMHGYMRMYWGKKILEWTESPEAAMRVAVYLNDRYSLDGRDPNGYTGIAWCIGGVHDRAWNERPIFGKLRYMSYNGAKTKFDVNGYIEKIRSM